MFPAWEPDDVCENCYRRFGVHTYVPNSIDKYECPTGDGHFVPVSDDDFDYDDDDYGYDWWDDPEEDD